MSWLIVGMRIKPPVRTGRRRILGGARLSRRQTRRPTLRPSSRATFEGGPRSGTVRCVTKKLTRSKRKDLRAKGQLKPVPRVPAAQKAAERQAEEEAASARVHDARAAIAHRDDEDEAPPAAPKKAKTGRRDLTLFLL